MFEHLTVEEGAKAAKTIFDYLKPGGFIRVAVPDRHFPDEEYQRGVQVGGPGPSDHPAANHKVVYGYRELVEVFEEAEFEVRLLEYHDEKGRFHLNEWNLDEAPVYRSSKLDHRNRNGKIGFASLIIDAVKRKYVYRDRDAPHEAVLPHYLSITHKYHAESPGSSPRSSLPGASSLSTERLSPVGRRFFELSTHQAWRSR